MNITYTIAPLDGPDARTHLAELLGGGQTGVAKNIIRHLDGLGVKSYVLEDPYIDRDYSADYLEFYARTFRTHARHCKRVHFFSDDISPLLCSPLTTERLQYLSQTASASYCGFCVIRPLPTAPIGRTVLLARVRDSFNMEATVTCRADFKANLFGVDLQVTGTPFLQQDARVGACAQVAIWVGMRHMYARYGHAWVSVADITRFATPTTSTEAASLPPGSDFLTSESMIRGISEAGYQALCFRGGDICCDILPYVESGIPVILGLNNGGTIGHAVTVIGRGFAKLDCPTKRPVDYVPAYLVHDDQGGPYMWLPMHKNAGGTHAFHGGTVKRFAQELNVQCHATFAVALMSPKVFSTAAAAEVSARDRIEEVLTNMAEIRRSLTKRDIPFNERLLDELEAAHRDDCIVLRTYLTSAAGYRRHLAYGTASNGLKDMLLGLHLPHFTWVTEISTIDSYNNASPSKRCIYGHTVLDATSTGRGGDGMLMLHLPGLVFTNDVNSPPEKQMMLTIIEDDELYECREKWL